MATNKSSAKKAGTAKKASARKEDMTWVNFAEEPAERIYANEIKFSVTFPRDAELVFCDRYHKLNGITEIVDEKIRVVLPIEKFIAMAQKMKELLEDLEKKGVIIKKADES